MISKNELLSLLICPGCKKTLRSFAHCANCGAEYSESDGTPVLVPKKAIRRVSFDFSQDRATVGDSFRACFSYPPRSGAATAAGKPYHLDLAHSDAFDSLPAGSLVLEPGCGGGQMRSYLESKFFRYVGIDMSKTRVDEELQRHGGPDLICDAHFLPFMDQAFDVVYTSALTQHVACPYLLAQEIARVLKPGGYYFGNVSFLEPWHDDSFFHMSPLGVFETLTQAHFDIVHIWPGRGYSGFRAIMDMGNKAARPLRFLGDIMYCIYTFGWRLRNLAKSIKSDGIMEAARVSAAMDWIARKPA